jgi:hypothetical protein
VEPIPAPSETSVLKELISIYMKANCKALEPEQLKEEAERLLKRLNKQAAGRVCWHSREEWEAAYKRIDAYYTEKRDWNTLFK